MSSDYLEDMEQAVGAFRSRLTLGKWFDRKLAFELWRLGEFDGLTETSKVRCVFDRRKGSKVEAGLDLELQELKFDNLKDKSRGHEGAESAC